MIKKLLLPSILIVIVLGLVGIFMTGNSPDKTTDKPKTFATKASADGLPGLLTTQGPWDANTAKLKDRLDAIGLPALDQEALAFHIHQHLEMFVHGQAVPVPPSIGIGSNFISILHTHDTSGVLHVESPVKTDYTLGQFYDEWGVKLASDQLGGYKNDGTNTLKVFVDGKPVITDPRKIVLKAHQEIVITYGTASEVPNPIPSTYKFPEGE